MDSNAYEKELRARLLAGMDENCLNVVLNGEKVDIPCELIDDEAIFRSVLNFETWQGLSLAEKSHLQKFLPPGAPETQKFQEEAVRLTFSNDKNLKHGNPVSVLYRNIKAGKCSPSIIRRLEKCRSLKFKDYKLKEKQRCRRLLQGILVSRQRILDQLARHGPGQPLHHIRPEPVETSTTVDERVHKRFQRIIKDIKTECNDDGISSDEEEYNFQSYERQHEAFRSPTGAYEMSEETYKSILEMHRKRRLCSEAHPELDVSAISLADIIMRANPMKKANKKSKKVKRIKKSRDEKMKCKKKHKPQLPPLSERDVMRIKQLSSKQTASERERILQEDKTEDPQDSSSDNDEEELEQCFFALLKGYFFEKEDFQCSTAELQQEVVIWENSDESTSLLWTRESQSWSELVIPALNFLAGNLKTNALSEFDPFVHFIPERNTWKWIDQDDDSILLPLCNYWLEIVKQERLGGEQGSESPSSIHQQKTDFVVRPSTGQEKMTFQMQERKRYENPHKPFIYKMHGFSSIVGPVKGVFNKDTGSSKAREHALLISNRPAYVTILSLVRDAVARLPNGEGTRAEVCQLLKDSQFINPEATDGQVHAVVSGALDRLHAEKDPCVKYDITRKLWVYLHRVRSVEEFERIHQASAAAAMAKKQMNQKQKAPSKKKTSQEQLSGADDQIKAKVKVSKSSGDKPKKSSKKPKASSPNPESILTLDQSDVASTPSSSPMNTSFHSDYFNPKEEVLTPPARFPEHLTYFAQVRGTLPVATSNQQPLQAAVPLKITFPRGALGSFPSSSVALQIPKASERRISIGSGQQEPIRHVNLSEHLLLNQNSAEFLPQIDPAFEASLP